jgi:hypothetical protein
MRPPGDEKLKSGIYGFSKKIGFQIKLQGQQQMT